MSRYDNQIVDQVQQANDIVEVVGQYVPLKKAGSNYKGRCPFHDEKTPSFMVSAEKQIYHCFGCGVGGNVFGFLMQYENMSFPEALRQLADRSNIRLPELKTSGSQDNKPSEYERLHEVYRLSEVYYHAIFMHPEKGKSARDYFQSRGFSIELAKEFAIGWAENEWRGLYTYLGKKQVPESLQLTARLVNRSDKGNCYDVFRGRLIFPIRNLQGKTVAFGGRVIGASDGPKYLNSPENPIFHKRRELFGLDKAKRHFDRDLPRVLVVEGYLDFLRLYDCGFKNTVATLGTALSEDHVTLLKRFVQEAVVIYDGDKAGQAASLRGLEVFLEGGLSVKLVQMPEGEDPDDFLRSKGAEAFSKLVENARDFFEYKLDVLTQRYKVDDSLGLIKITNEALETLAKVDSPILLDIYIRKMSGVLGIDESSLRTEHQKLLKRLGGQRNPGQPVQKTSAERGNGKGANANGTPDEVLLLGLIIDEPRFSEKAFQQLGEQDISSKTGQSLLLYLMKLKKAGETWSWPQVLSRLDDEDFKQQLVSVTSFEWEPGGKEHAFSDCLKSVIRKRLMRRLDEIRREITRAEHLGDQDKVVACTREYQSLLQQMR